jgi:nitrogen fixation/metabolism regulation signal transduction histidine kinase
VVEFAREALVKILANPVLLRAAVTFFCASFAFLLGLIFIRLLRKSITEDAEISSEPAPSLETLPLHLYNTVIQQLKQQKHELQVQSQAEQQRARTTETFSQAVLANLSCGVLVFGTNGLVKTSNPAAKQILGFASTTGMGAEDIFRGAAVCGSKVRNEASSGEATHHDAVDETFDDSVRLADEVDSVLREGSTRRQVEAQYETPAGEKRFIAVTVSSVPAADGGLLGVACLINDLSELDRIRRQQALQGEISAEMALQLRTSLTTISGYAQQLAASRDQELTRQLAADIAQEAAELDRNIGGFLTDKRAAQAAGTAN